MSRDIASGAVDRRGAGLFTALPVGSGNADEHGIQVCDPSSTAERSRNTADMQSDADKGPEQHNQRRYRTT